MQLRNVFAAAGVIALPAPPPTGGELTPVSQALLVAGFEKIGVERGITIYQDEDSDVIRVAAEGEITASPHEVLEALLAYERQPGLVERVSESEVLERGDSALVVYQHLNLPVISDRDYVLRVRWGTDGTTLWLTYSAVTGVGPPERDGIVRVVDHAGSWQLEPAQDGAATKARFQMRMDLAGLLPRWMAASHATDEIPALFDSILRLATTPAAE